jgi:phosphopantetheinyl transferase
MRKFDIFVACAKLDEFGGRAKDCLSASELQRAARFETPRRQQEFLAGRVLLRSLLERFTGRGRGSHQIVVADNGKPICVEGPAISIAHSGDTVVCAVTGDGALGIDIELPPCPREAGKIAERFFAEEEAAWIAEGPDERFLMLWVIKEAWLKATGRGISGGLDSLHCSILPPDIAARHRANQTANLSVYLRNGAFIGLATTATLHESVISYRWAQRANILVGDSSWRRIAATRKSTSAQFLRCAPSRLGAGQTANSALSAIESTHRQK